MDLSGAEGGFIGGILAVVLLGAILSILSSGVGAFTKLGWILYDIGISGLSWALLNEAVESENPDTYRALMALAGALVLALGLRF